MLDKPLGAQQVFKTFEIIKHNEIAQGRKRWIPNILDDKTGWKAVDNKRKDQQGFEKIFQFQI